MEKLRNSEAFSWVVTILIAVILALTIRTFIAEPVRVQQSSMYPTLVDGDKVLLSKFSYLVGDPQYGDIVVVKIENKNKNYVKRVIGLPGDTIEIVNKTLYRNGELIKEDYIPIDIDYYEDFGSITVPENCYFLLGDNRPVSIDSRDSSVGCIERSQFKGKVVFRLLPFSSFGSVY